MVPVDSPNVDRYLEDLPPERREALSQVRALVLQTAPGAEETMRYRMPTYEVGDQVLCSFASQKHYMSLYMDVDLVERYRGDLAGLDVGKSCIRFRRIEDLPLDTVRLILQKTLEAR